MMRGVRGVFLALVLMVASDAHADLLARALDAGGGGTATTAASTDDLLAWAGEPKPIALPELLQLAIRQAPALAGARLDVAIAQAQIGETLERHDWKFSATA